MSLAKLATEAVADLYIRLSADSASLESLLKLIGQSRAELASSTDPIVTAASAAFSKAGEAALQHVALVLQNNRTRPIAEVLARPDVQEALSVPFQKAVPSVQKSVQSAWDAGWEVGSASATKNAALLGLFDEPAGPSDFDKTYVEALKADVQKNADAAGQRLAAAITAAPPGGVHLAMVRVLDDLDRRVGMSADAARQRASTEARQRKAAQIAKVQGVKLRVLWVTHFSARTCATCAKLHGKTAAIGEGFPTTSTFHGKPPAPYVDLVGPPRHPNCRCELVYYVQGKAGAWSPTAMQQWAKAWWAQHSGGTGD